MKIFEITGYFGYWGMMATVNIRANSFKEATQDLKKKVMKIYEGRGKGSHQNKFHCTVVGYRVVEEIKPFIEFKNRRVF